MNNAGRHVLADAYLDAYPGDDAVMRACEQGIAASGMTVVAQTVKRFDPHGVTAVWILQESHFTVHTYPEHAYISIDCYTCGDEGDPDAAIAHVLAALPARPGAEVVRLTRGAVAPVGGNQGSAARSHVAA